MVRFNMSQLNSKIRQAQQKQRQAIAKINREIKAYNQDARRAINNYNQAIRKYNSQVKRNRQIIRQEMQRLNSSRTTRLTVSVKSMQHYYDAIATNYNEGVTVNLETDKILDLIEIENANSIVTANMIENDTIPYENTEDIEIGNKLCAISIDLNNRWQGAVFSLNPLNPDATRHFCTSARELFTNLIELKAPDQEVFNFNPSCQITDNGNPTRREKIKYMMRNKITDENIVAFADEDIKNILELFHVLSDGTHGESGKYSYEKLKQVKKRVESGINFLCEISA